MHAGAPTQPIALAAAFLQGRRQRGAGALQVPAFDTGVQWTAGLMEACELKLASICLMSQPQVALT